MSFAERLRISSERALADVDWMLGYDEMIDPETGELRKVSRVSETTRQKMNLALVALHPEVMAKAQGPAIRVEISAELVNVALAAGREMDGAIEGSGIFARAGAAGVGVAGEDLGSGRRGAARYLGAGAEPGDEGSAVPVDVAGDAK